jgi:type I restriction enzyme R subunit
MSTPSYLEDRISQIPALRLLMALGWQYLTPDEAMRLRGGKQRDVILEGVLLPWLREHNHIQHKGQRHAFNEANLSGALRALTDVQLNQGLVPASQAVYERLTLGTSAEQVIGGDRRSFNLHYIDWEHPENNIYQVADEFVVERRGSYQTRRPDIVLFVNGIPLAVIECKRPDQQTGEGEKAVYEGVSQMLRNQRLDDEIPHLFVYTQLLLAVSVNDALYSTTGTAKDFWAVWKEENENEAELEWLANVPLTDAEKSRLYNWRDNGHWIQRYFDDKDAGGNRLPTEQDRTLAALLRPARLLELAYGYIVYDGGVKKIARYQQYFAIRSTLQRIQQRDADGQRAGGVIWHTTGSGKSLTMVMLAKALALHPAVSNPRVVIVTDRIDLDAQIWGTFKACGKQVYQADSGSDLMRLIREPKHEIITTVIDKFETAAQGKLRDENPDVFVLVDESHRSQYGSSHAKMREVFPNACYIGFTGTPLMKQEKTTAARFGGFIHKYTMRQAVADKAVVPLLYEGRIVDLDVGREALDQWFERRTATLTDDQKIDLKRKMSRFEEVNRTRARLEAIAYDIAQHYITNWRGTGYKGQLATASKELAIQFMYALEDEGVHCAVIISAPDTREGNEDTDETKLKPVQDFWKRMMQLYSTEEIYLRETKASFGREDGIEILIVVDKLLVGFDEPRNTVLYIDKPLKEHGLLQAIARVNRLYQGKDYGYIIDYRGVLGELNEALETYNALEAFDSEDVAGTVTDINQAVDELPGHYDQLWAIFDPVSNKQDTEALERFLEPEDRRQHFYDALNTFARSLKVALGSVEFYERTPEARVNAYKRDLLFFHALRSSVKLRYAESVDYSEYEQKIRKLLNDHIKATNVSVVVPEVNIFNEEAFHEALGHLNTAASRADAIAYKLKKTATEKMEEDPAFYRKFSQMVEATIEAYRQGRLDEIEYLNEMEAARQQMLAGRDTGLPPQLAGYADAGAYYGLLAEDLNPHAPNADGMFHGAMADLAIQFEAAINALKIRDWVNNPDVMNQMKNALEDHLYDFKGAHAMSLTGAEMDTIINRVMDTAQKRNHLTA